MYAKNTASLMEEVKEMKNTIKSFGAVAIILIGYTAGCNAAFEAGKRLESCGYGDVSLREMMVEAVKYRIGMKTKFDD
jgi:thioesterase domain-containing protein